MPDVQPAGAWLWLVLPLACAVGLALLGQAAPAFYAEYMAPEIGILELAHVLQGAAGAVLAALLLIRPEVLSRPWLATWVGLAFLGCFYVAGEEASWGQHLFAWTTPAEWRALNDQQETNLHNVSSWFDQKPRLLLELGVIIGGLVLPLLRRGGRYLQRGRIAYITPPFACLPTAAIAFLIRIEDVTVDMSGLRSGLFYRSSEVQEFFFYLFVLLYLMALRRRIAATPPPA